MNGMPDTRMIQLVMALRTAGVSNKEVLAAIRDWNARQKDGPIAFGTQVSIDAARDPEIMQLCGEVRSDKDAHVLNRSQSPDPFGTLLRR